MYKEDLRIVRTRKLLSNTLLEMMEEQSIEKISVIDLCSRAMVNRATFYAHFEDKYHLLTFALEDLKDTLYEQFTQSNSKANSPSEILLHIAQMTISFLFEQKNHIVNIISHNRNGKIVQTIESSMAQSIRYQLAKFKSSYDYGMPVTIISNFIAGGMMSTLLLCIDNPGKYTKEDLEKYASFYFTNLVTIEKTN